METVQELIDELDNYGRHLPVVLEDRRGHRYTVTVDTVTTRNGVVVVVAPVGEPVDIDAREGED